MKKILIVGNQIYHFKSSSGSRTVSNYGFFSRSDFLISYGSGFSSCFHVNATPKKEERTDVDA